MWLKPAGVSSFFTRSSSRMSSRSLGTITMGAPWNRSALLLAKPEYCVPAMGWPPTKVKPYSSARAKPVRQTSRFTPQQSMTSVSLEM